MFNLAQQIFALKNKTRKTYRKHIMTKTYASKISYSLLSIVAIAFFSPIILKLIRNGIDFKFIFINLFLIIIFGLILHMFLKTTYTIEDDKLKIKCGFFKYKPIKISAIKEISKSSNLRSSPAPSFDRIEIKYGKVEKMIISPKNKLQFTKNLTCLNPNIKNNVTEN